MGPLPSCAECVPGFFVCPVHLQPCNARAASTCSCCHRCLCAGHLSCFCVDAERREDDGKTARNVLLASRAAASKKSALKLTFANFPQPPNVDINTTLGECKCPYGYCLSPGPTYNGPPV